MKIEVDLPENLDLVGIAREIKLRLAMRETGFQSLTGLEELGIVVFIAVEKAGFYKEKIAEPKKRKKGKKI